MSIKISNNIGFCVHEEFFKLIARALGLKLLFQIMFCFYIEKILSLPSRRIETSARAFCDGGKAL